MWLQVFLSNNFQTDLFDLVFEVVAFEGKVLLGVCMSNKIKNINSQIITNIYYKPTDTHQYLHFKSYHTENCIKSIPYTLIHRIHTIIMDKNKNKLALKIYTQLYTRDDIQQH